MAIRTLIVDDDPLAITVLESYIAKVPNLEVIGTCNSALDIYEILLTKTVDLIFLDVEMPKLSGIDFLKSVEKHPNIIITSANKDYAWEGFELDVIDYLIKPFKFDRLLQAIEKIPPEQDSSEMERISDDAIFVKENKKMIKLMLHDILLIESIKDYVKIKVQDKTVITKQLLSFFEEKLAENGFIRIHRSILVPIQKIESYNSTSLSIEGKQYPIGRSYKTVVLEKLKKILS